MSKNTNKVSNKEVNKQKKTTVSGDQITQRKLSPKHLLSQDEIKKKVIENSSKKTYLIDPEDSDQCNLFENEDYMVKKKNVFLQYDSDNNDTIFKR